MANMMSRRENNNKFNNNGDKNVTFDKDHMIPKGACTALAPKSIF